MGGGAAAAKELEAEGVQMGTWRPPALSARACHAEGLPHAHGPVLPGRTIEERERGGHQPAPAHQLLAWVKFTGSGGMNVHARPFGLQLLCGRGLKGVAGI